MKYTKKKIDNSNLEFVATWAEEDIKVAKDEAIAEKSKDLKAPGFRAGKVPKNVAEKYLSDAVISETTAEILLNKALVELITKEQLQLLDKPEAKIVKWVPYTDLEVRIEISVIPPIKLGGYMDLKAKKPEIKVDEKEVDQLIENLRLQGSTRKDVDRAAKEGDEVLIDFVGKKDGKEFEGGKANNIPLLLGSKQMIPGFEEGIEGHKAGEEFTIKVTFPKEYGAKELAGKKADFDIKVHKVVELNKPELDDKFAASVGPFYTVKELKDAAKKELVGREQFSADERYKSDLLAELVKKSKIEVPEVLLEDQTSAIRKEAEDNIKARNQTVDQYIKQQGFKDEADWVEKEIKPEAKRRIQNGLVMAELARAEKVEVTEAEITDRLNQMTVGVTDEETKKQFQTDQARRDISNRIATEKALNKLVSYNS